MLAIVLSLTTSVLYGVANFLGPYLMRRHPQPVVMVGGQAAALVLALVVLAFAGEGAPSLGPVLLAAAAGLGNAFGLIGFLEGVRYGPVSVVAPIGACGGAGPAVFGLAGGDPVTAARVIGIALAMGGAVLVARRPGPSSADRALGDGAGESPAAAGTAASHASLTVASQAAGPRTFSASDRRKCLAWSISSAAGFAVLLVALPKAAEDGGRWWALSVIRVVIMLSVITLLAARRQRVRLPRNARSLAALGLPGALLLTGTALYAIAAKHGDLSVVGVCSTLYPLVTVGLAIAVLKERATGTQLAGAIAATVGVALLAAG